MPLGLSGFMPAWGSERPVNVRQAGGPSSSAQNGTQRKTIGCKGVIGGGKEKHGLGGVGLGKGGMKRHQ